MLEGLAGNWQLYQVAACNTAVCTLGDLICFTTDKISRLWMFHEPESHVVIVSGRGIMLQQVSILGSLEHARV